MIIIEIFLEPNVADGYECNVLTTTIILFNDTINQWLLLLWFRWSQFTFGWEVWGRDGAQVGFMSISHTRMCITPHLHPTRPLKQTRRGESLHEGWHQENKFKTQTSWGRTMMCSTYRMYILSTDVNNIRTKHNWKQLFYHETNYTKVILTRSSK